MSQLSDRHYVVRAAAGLNQTEFRCANAVVNYAH
jgi:hypothetical protein